MEADDGYNGRAGALLAFPVPNATRSRTYKSRIKFYTYKVPILNIMMIYIFFFVLSDKRNSSGIGTAMMTRSRTMLIAA